MLAECAIEHRDNNPIYTLQLEPCVAGASDCVHSWRLGSLHYLPQTIVLERVNKQKKAGEVIFSRVDKNFALIGSTEAVGLGDLLSFPRRDPP
jgi:hypothetical protein